MKNRKCFTNACNKYYATKSLFYTVGSKRIKYKVFYLLIMSIIYGCQVSSDDKRDDIDRYKEDIEIYRTEMKKIKTERDSLLIELKKNDQINNSDTNDSYSNEDKSKSINTRVNNLISNFLLEESTLSKDGFLIQKENNKWSFDSKNHVIIREEKNTFYIKNQIPNENTITEYSKIQLKKIIPSKIYIRERIIDNDLHQYREDYDLYIQTNGEGVHTIYESGELFGNDDWIPLKINLADKDSQAKLLHELKEIIKLLND